MLLCHSVPRSAARTLRRPLSPCRASRSERAGNGSNGLSALRRCYLDVTEFVLSHVRDVYERHGVRWSAGAFASITATLFITETKPEFRRQGYGSQATREGP